MIPRREIAPEHGGSPSRIIVFIEENPILDVDENDAKSFLSTCQEWSQLILDVLDEHVSLFNPTRNQMVYGSRHTRALTVSVELSDMEDDFLKAYDFGRSTSWRVYTSLPSVVEPRDNCPSETHAVVFNGMTPSPELDSDFNLWYTKEHIFMLSNVPGWLYSKRYKLLSSSSTGVPEYLAIHAWSSRESFDCELYKAAISTPWRNSVVFNVLSRERRVLDFVNFNG